MSIYHTQLQRSLFYNLFDKYFHYGWIKLASGTSANFSDSVFLTHSLSVKSYRKS